MYGNGLRQYAFGYLEYYIALTVLATCAVHKEELVEEQERICTLLEINKIREYGKEAIRKDDEDCYDYKRRAKRISHRGYEQELAELREKYEVEDLTDSEK